MFDSWMSLFYTIACTDEHRMVSNVKQKQNMNTFQIVITAQKIDHAPINDVCRKVFCYFIC